jgi:hypothetical protein
MFSSKSKQRLGWVWWRRLLDGVWEAQTFMG